jgi:MYXO-CTERM domain-containing protein
MRTWIVPLLLFAAPALSASPAAADVVMSPPDDCPRGEVGVTSHGGPRCVKEAPTDCPVGWRGMLGGTCSLTPCENDQGCQAGEACVEHSVCLQPFEDSFYDYGEDEREEHGELEPPAWDVLRAPGLLAGPMAPKKPRDKPITRYNAANLCSREVACAAPGTCQPEKLCVPRGSRALAYRGTNSSAVRVARKTATPLTSSGAEPTEQPAALSPKSGCAGCRTAPAPDEPWALALALGVGVALMRRRRR